MVKGTNNAPLVSVPILDSLVVRGVCLMNSNGEIEGLPEIERRVVGYDKVA